MTDKNTIQIPKRLIVSSLIMFAFFVMFTVTVKCFDILPEAAGNATAVGFGELNTAVYGACGIFGYLAGWRIVSECLLAVAVGVAIAIVCLGFWQMANGKSLKALDKRIALAAAAYLDLALFYGLFRILRINYGPVIVGDRVLPSYPSFCVLASFVILGTAISLVKRYITEAELKKIMVYAFEALRIIIIILRLICGTEWLTDIIGALLLGASMLLMYRAGLEIVEMSENE